MPLKDFFKGLNTRKASRDRDKSAPAKEKCPLEKGDIFIGVCRFDTMEPLEGIPTKIKGPSGGAMNTDDMGLAVYLDRNPGKYHFDVTYGQQYPPDSIHNHEGDFSLSGGRIAVETSGVTPVGQLLVKVHQKNNDGSPGPLLAAADVLSITGIPDPLYRANNHTISNLPLGDYTLFVKVNTDRYLPATVKSELLTVKEGETTEAVFLVDENSWVELVVRDMTTPQNLADCIAEIEITGGQTVSMVTGEDKPSRYNGAKTGDDCRLKSVTAPKNEVYEFIEIVDSTTNP